MYDDNKYIETPNSKFCNNSPVLLCSLTLSHTARHANKSKGGFVNNRIQRTGNVTMENINLNNLCAYLLIRFKFKELKDQSIGFPHWQTGEHGLWNFGPRKYATKIKTSNESYQGTVFSDRPILLFRLAWKKSLNLTKDVFFIMFLCNCSWNRLLTTWFV